MSNDKNVRFGATSWDEVEINNNNKERKSTRDQYLRLENGDNVVRVITKPHEYSVHRVKFDKNDPGFGERIMSCAAHGDGDPLTEAPFNSKAKRRWLVGVIDRKTASYRILDMSTQVFQGIQGLVRDLEWGEPSQYDVNVRVDKSAGPSGYYSVIPKPKKPLSSTDIELREQVDLEELKRKCTPPTREMVEARIKTILEKRGVKTATATGNGTVTAETAEEDSDFDFPAVN